MNQEQMRNRTKEFAKQIITLIERKIIPSLKCFSDDEAIREFSESVVKIPLNPPLLKGDENGFSPLEKGS